MARMTMLLVLAFTIVGAAWAQDTGSFCKSYAQCTKDADDARLECDKLIIIPVASANATQPPASKKSSGDCSSNVKNISAQLVQLQQEQRQQERDCLAKHLDDAIPVEKSRQAQCTSLVSAGGKGASTRLKKRAAVVVKAKDTPPAATTPIPSSTNSSKSGNDSDVFRINTDYSAYPKCVEAAEKKAEQCRSFASCCSEIQTCDFEYKLSPLYSQIIQLHYDLYKQYRQCQKERNAQVESKKSPKQ